MRLVHPEVADEIAVYLERKSETLMKEPFHLTDQEEAFRLRKLATAIRSLDGEIAFDYARSFSVEGRYPFPIDLLREYACVPATPQDSKRLAGLFDDPMTPVRICLRRLTQCEFDRCRPPVAGFYEAFAAYGWPVVGDGR